MNNQSHLPVITLWQPWATWVMLSWKRIETRTHSRFACLTGKTIGIHAAEKMDLAAAFVAKNFLTDQQRRLMDPYRHVRGAIICTARVEYHRLLTDADSSEALIDCGNVMRYGLILREITPIMPILCRGKQGIWYHRGAVERL